jgi:hypothetical protein
MKIATRVLVTLLALLCILALNTAGFGGGKKVLTTEVTVFDAKNKPAVKRQVLLEFGSLKEPVFSVTAVTNAQGVATIKHYREGEARVWVDGDYGTQTATGKAPGKIAVHLGDGPSLFYAIDRHALAAPPEVEETVDKLAKYLAEPAQNDVEKARAIYRWITDRIAYDSESYFAGTRGDNTPQGVLKARKCVCEGYTKLFEALAKNMDLEAAYISGQFKDSHAILNELVRSHGWNAVKIDGNWKLVDATLGAGALLNKRFFKAMEEFYFMPAPELLLFSHLPNDGKWQFRDPPLTSAEFDAFPAVPRQVLEMGAPAARVWKMLKEEKIKEFCEFYRTTGRKVILRDGPVAKTLQAGMKYRFLLEAADYPAVAFIQKENPIFFQRKGPLFEGFIAPRKGNLKIVGFEQPGGGAWRGFVSYEVE